MTAPVRTLAFIAGASAKNMLRRQLTRLRQPRYLAGWAVGGLYVWSVFARHGLRAPHGIAFQVSTAILASFMLALALGTALYAWAFGGDEAALTFTEAEIQFLFPAPLTRAQLIHYKLARTLVFSSFTALLFTWGFAGRLGFDGARFFIGAWIGVATVGLHGIAASLTRASLLQHGVASSVRQILSGTVALAIIAAIAWTLHRAPLPDRAVDVPEWFTRILGTGPLYWVSMPFRPAVSFALALPGTSSAAAGAGALGSLALHYAWALGTDADFQDASILAAERRSRRVAQWRRGRMPVRANARPPFRLAATGAPAVALIWKNLTAAARLLSLRLAIATAMVAALALAPAAFEGGDARRALAAGGLAMLAGYFTFFGMQIYRIDFRLDLPNMDLLRTLPLAGWQVALAEVLAPTLVVTFAQAACLCGATALVPSSTLFGVARWGIALALLLFLPAVSLALVVVQNTGALMFPGWVHAGVQGPRGIEAMGQRLLTLAGTLLVSILAFVPAAAVGAGVGGGLSLALHWTTGAAILGAASASAVLLVEAAFGVLFLGRLFERFDLGQA